jgi:hypothetical protein
MAIKGGYMGLCEVDGLEIRVSSFSVNVKQEVQFYDHIIGLRDSAPFGLFSKGDSGNLNVQKYFWRPGVKIVSGSFSFPATTEALQKTFDLVKTGDDFTLKFSYACDDVKRVFEFCKVNSFSFSVSAGEIATVQVDVMGRAIEEEIGVSPRYRDPEKLLTWDAINLTTISTDPIQLFNFTVNNSCMPIYTAGSNNSGDLLFPKEIRVGMQQLTGSLVYYVKGVDYEGLDQFSADEIIKIEISDKCVNLLEPTFSEELCVIYKPVERAGSTGALLHTLPFVGVGRALGEP